MATIAIFNGIQRQIDSFNSLLNCVNSLLNSVNHVHGMSIRELIAPGTVEVEGPRVDSGRVRGVLRGLEREPRCDVVD